MKRSTRIALFLVAGILLGFFFADTVLSDTGGPPVPLPSETPIIVTPEPVVTPEPTLEPTAEPTIPPVTPEPTIIPPPLPDVDISDLLKENQLLEEENAVLIQENTELVNKNDALTTTNSDLANLLIILGLVLSTAVFLMAFFNYRLYKILKQIFFDW